MWAKEMNNCLSCKYEPDWDDPSENFGWCKWEKAIPIIYSSGWIRKEGGLILKYDDNSTSEENCKAWEAK